MYDYVIIYIYSFYFNYLFVVKTNSSAVRIVSENRLQKQGNMTRYPTRRGDGSIPSAKCPKQLWRHPVPFSISNVSSFPWVKELWV